MRIVLYVLLPTARGRVLDLDVGLPVGVQQRLAGDVRERGARLADAVDDVAAQDPEVAHREVVRLPEDAPVDQPDRLAAERAVRGGLLLAELPEHDVGAGHRLVDEVDDLLRRVLQVVVHRDHVVAGGVAQAAEVRVVLPVVAEQVDRAHVLVPFHGVAQDVPRVVGAAVVDEHDLVREALRLEEGDRAVDRGADQRLAVEHGDHDRVLEAPRVERRLALRRGRFGRFDRHAEPGGPARAVRSPPEPQVASSLSAPARRRGRRGTPRRRARSARSRGCCGRGAAAAGR